MARTRAPPLRLGCAAARTNSHTTHRPHQQPHTHTAATTPSRDQAPGWHWQLAPTTGIDNWPRQLAPTAGTGTSTSPTSTHRELREGLVHLEQQLVLLHGRGRRTTALHEACRRRRCKVGAHTRSAIGQTPFFCRGRKVCGHVHPWGQSLAIRGKSLQGRLAFYAISLYKSRFEGGAVVLWLVVDGC